MSTGKKVLRQQIDATFWAILEGPEMLTKSSLGWTIMWIIIVWVAILSILGPLYPRDRQHEMYRAPVCHSHQIENALNKNPWLILIKFSWNFIMDAKFI